MISIGSKPLVVGDVHATPDELGDCDALLDYVTEVASSEKASSVIFLGDIYHTHGMVRVEVMSFWKRRFAQLSKVCPVFVLLGNHDRPNDSSVKDHALLAHEHVVRVVDTPTVTAEGVLLLPYYHENEEFVNECRKHEECHTVICHQTFDGGKYENGAYMKDGVDQTQIPQSFVVGGHIHTPQEFGKVLYVGAPRWRSLSDASVDTRNLTLFDVDSGMKVAKQFSTNERCSRIVYAKITEQSPDVPVVSAKDRVYLDVHGADGFVEKTVAAIKETKVGVKVRTFKETKRVAKVKESDGIPVAFRKYFASFVPPFGTPKEVVMEAVSGRIESMV